jgi:hypothetical protein
MWARRNVVYGMAHDASLVARVLALGGTPYTWGDDAKKAVNKIHERAAEVALAHKGADIGTAVHTMTERVDRGEQFDAGIYEADITAYVSALIRAELYVDPAHIECRLVCDELEMAGTADRILAHADGRRLIADIKTGASVDYGGLGWAAQLASYAHGTLYDVAKAQRVDTPRSTAPPGSSSTSRPAKGSAPSTRSTSSPGSAPRSWPTRSARCARRRDGGSPRWQD